MSDDLNLDELDDLVRRYVFSANFDGDAAEERREIHKWVNEAILAERQRANELLEAANGILDGSIQMLITVEASQKLDRLSMAIHSYKSQS